MQLADIPDDPGNVILDTMMSLVLLLFLAEIVVCCLVDRNYLWSFFFFMDTIGSLSVIFEISFLLGPAGKPSTSNAAVDPTLMRAARIAKIASRGGRFMKLAKCLEMIAPRKAKESEETARVLSTKLSGSVSAKVSLLTIMIVVFLPVFSLEEYPVEDLSMRMWVNRLEQQYTRAFTTMEQSPAATTTSLFSDVVEDLVSFYSDVDYFPFDSVGYQEQLVIAGREVTIPGVVLLAKEEAPKRKQNMLVTEVASCMVAREFCTNDQKACVSFNFSAPKQREAAGEMGMSLFVVVVMCIASASISSRIENLVIVKLQRMLSLTADTAWTILSIGENMEGVSKNSGFDFNVGDTDEAELLEAVLEKLARIATIVTTTNVAGTVDVKNMDRESLGVVVDIMRASTATKTSGLSMSSGAMNVNHMFSILTTSSISHNSKMHVCEDLRLSIESDDWMLAFLELSAADRERVAMYMVFNGLASQHLRDGNFLRDKTFKAFYRAIVVSYLDVPYHNATHAVDVMHTVYRYLVATEALLWMSGVQHTALLIAALCHDVGHIGKTNHFLIETRHALACSYNDRSPLENLHCAVMFRIAQQPTTDIFGDLSTEDYQVARRICIECILKTDNSFHLEMVKELQTIYEVNAEIVESQARSPWEDERYRSLVRVRGGRSRALSVASTRSEGRWMIRAGMGAQGSDVDPCPSFQP